MSFPVCVGVVVVVSIAVHVRRGDYVRLGMAMLGEDYYTMAIKKIVAASETNEAKVFFFSEPSGPVMDQN